jgi:hypothetical protein
MNRAAALLEDALDGDERRARQLLDLGEQARHAAV